ncbi:hypothetical protein BDZ97DRAFT_1350388 [Flammula alnicola]|nr:hypothetical protein BDZ97DRAFT_1350388 [Flammula alnicola]
MSNHLSSYAPSLGHQRKRAHPQDIYTKPTSTWSPRYDAHSAFSSSPPRASSPPRTPYSTRHAYGYAHIRSSPEVSADLAFRGVGEHVEDPSSSWSHRYSTDPLFKHSASAYTRVPYNSIYSTNHDYPAPSDFDVSEFSEDVEHDIPDLDSEPTSDSTPGQSSSVFSDSEEEEARDDDSDAFSFGGYNGNRTTFFRTSAERGQWKSNPMPFRPATSLLQSSRKSVPTLSRVSTPTLAVANLARPISEPAPSTCPAEPDFITSENPDLPSRAREAIISNSDSVPINPPLLSEEVESPHTLPSLTSDRESSQEEDEHEVPSSPLPSSSPPMSPMSFSVSRMSRSVSPISFARDSSSFRDSSPLSDVPDDELETEDMRESDTNSKNSDDDLTTNSALIIPTAEIEPLRTSESVSQTSNPSISHETIASANQPIDPSTPSLLVNPSPSLPGDTSSDAPPDPAISEDVVMASSEIDSAPSAAKLSSFEVATDFPSKATPQDEGVQMTRSATLRDKNGVDRSSPEVTTAAAIKEKGKRKKEQSSEGPTKKKRKTATKDDVEPSCSSSISNASASKRRIEEEENAENDSASEPAVFVPKPRRKKRNDGDATATTSSTTKRGTTKSRRSKARASSVYHDYSDEEAEHTSLDQHLDPETAALHAQVCGMLIETMAMSRASSLPVSSLFKLVMQDQPALKEQRTEREWIKLFDRVLHSGEARRGSGVFGKVESSGKDDADRPLEAQWFYVPELDEDQERATLIKAMMPRPAKRSETKKYKQYYWRPLDKISRWDPEDEL